MKPAAILLAATLIARNNLYFSGPFEVLRGLALVGVALVGLYGLLQPRTLRALPRYWPQFGYLAATLVSLAGTDYPFYVGFQTLSLAAVIIFAIACSEAKNALRIESGILTTAFYGYALTMLLSLALLAAKPALVYEVLYGGEHRFRGIFPKSGIAAASAGVLVGISLFTRGRSRWLRGLALLSALACLALTQSRTFWIAGLVATVATYLVYYRHGGKVLLSLGLLGVFAMALIYVADVRLETRSLKKFTRIETVSNLTGRLSLWNEALEKFAEQPYVGRGLTAGSSAFIDRSNVMGFNHEDDLSVDRSIGKSTMHSGYVQALLDLGAVGGVFYVSLILAALWRLFRNDTKRQHPTRWFLLVFLSIANLSENVIYAVTVFNSVLFFMVSAYAVGLRPAEPAPRTGTARHRLRAAPRLPAGRAT